MSAKKQQCFCGCDSFYIQLDEGAKNAPLIVCERCYCTRRVITPGVGVTSYDVTIPFKESKP